MLKHIKLATYALFTFVIAISNVVPVLAQKKPYTERQLRALGIYFVNQSNQPSSTISGAASGTDACYQLALPKINDLAGLAAAINSYISEKAPTSPFANLGSDIVQGAVRNGVNPMFVVGNMRMESAFGTTGTGSSGHNDLAVLLHKNFNAFGRTAGASQPHFTAANGRLWYKYPSWKDSVNSPGSSPLKTTDQPSLMRKVYLDDGLLTIGQYLGRYAPASDGNDESVYGKVLKDVVGAIITKAGAALSCTDTGATITPATLAPNPAPVTPTTGPR